MKVRPADLQCEGVVPFQRRDGVAIASVELVSCAHAIEIADRGPGVHVISGDKEPSPTPPKMRDRTALLDLQPVAHIHGKERQLVELVASMAESIGSGVSRAARSRAVTCS
jgi:hypothetical protein